MDRGVFSVMRHAVDFDCEPGFGAIEIEDVFTRSVLTAELEPAGPFAQFGPQQSFGK